MGDADDMVAVRRASSLDQAFFSLSLVHKHTLSAKISDSLRFGEQFRRGFKITGIWHTDMGIIK